MSIRKALYKPAFLLLTILLTSCLSTTKLSDTVKSKIGTDFLDEKPAVEEFLILKTDKLPVSDSLVLVEKKKSYFIPAIVFWGKENTLSCDINSRYFVKLFTDILDEKAKEFQLQKHLGDRKLEISIDAVPNNFVYTDKFYFIFAFVAYSYSYLEAVFPLNQNLSITYRILQNDGTEMKSGSFTAPTTESRANTINSHGRFIEKYLDEVKIRFEDQTDKMLDNIINELY